MSDGARPARWPRLAGFALAGVGLAHFISPTLFDGITAQAFPRQTRRHVYIDGGVETALGVALAARRTRNLAVIGGVGYLTYLGSHIARNAR